jgi:hypothetical protein
MTIIAWDGKSLAVDKVCVCSEMAFTVTKAKKVSETAVAAWTGDHEQGLALARWFKKGAFTTEWPKFQEGEKWTRLVLMDSSGVYCFERLPVRQYFEDPFMAWGSGRDYAMGAMAMGASAKQAAEIASQFNVYCGNGISVFSLNDKGDQDRAVRNLNQ